MRICIFFITFASLTISSRQTEKLESVVSNYEAIVDDTTKHCIEESKVKPDLVTAMIREGKYVQDRPLKCYLKCIYLKLEMLDDAGKINEENVKKNAGVADEHIKTKIVENCRNTRGDDLWESAFNLSRCTYETVKGNIRL